MTPADSAEESKGGSHEPRRRDEPDHDMDYLDRHLRSALSDREIVGLRFPPALEEQYKVHLRDSHRDPAYVCGFATTVVWCFFATFDIFRLRGAIVGGLDPGAIVWLCARWLALVLLLIALWAVKSRNDHYARFVFLSYVALGIAAAITATMARVKGQFSADSSQIIIIMGGFLPLGLLYRQALAATSIVAASSLFVISGGFEDRDVGHQIQLGVMIAIALPVAALGGYFRELADRRQFLFGLMLKESASTDQLTGLPNRRKFFEHANTVVRQAKRDKRTMCIALADIDFFKQYNDTRGHIAGDAAIQAVGAALKGTGRRPLDIVARYGGEEFILLYYGVNSDGAWGRLEAAMQCVRDLDLDHAASPTGKVSISIGYTLKAPDETDLAAVIARADSGLYAAKASGRATIALGGPLGG